jgi:ABC-type branched-subunit amino acid transport system permease subunit
MSLNIQYGYTGLLSLAQAAMFAVGTYVAVILITAYQFSWLVAIVVAIIANLGFSALIALLASRLRALYFAVATLCVQIIAISVILNWQVVTRGSLGISGIPAFSIAGFTFNAVSSFFWLGLIVVISGILFLLLFKKSPVYRMMLGVRDDELSVTALGKNPFYFKMTGMLISSVYATFAGVLYAGYMRYVDPMPFTLDESISLLAMVLIGGTGTITGPLLGAAIYVLTPELLYMFDIPTSGASSIRAMLFGLLLVIIMMVRPNGVMGSFTGK